MRIMFVCTGNICRSPLAHRVLEQRARERGIGDQIEVESSGIDHWHVGENADARMRRVAKEHGVLLHHRARQLTARDIEEYDIIFAMSAGHQRSIRAMAPGSVHDLEGKLFLFRRFDPVTAGSVRPPDVPDPYYGGNNGFEEVFQIVERTCDAILDEIEAGRLPLSA
jgi:protein-tyrosine phosphatase